MKRVVAVLFLLLLFMPQQTEASHGDFVVIDMSCFTEKNNNSSVSIADCIEIAETLNMPLAKNGAFFQRVDILKRTKQDVLKGKIPIFFTTYCNDEGISNKLKSLLISALRKKDNVKIVTNRSDAWLWLFIITNKDSDKNLTASMVFGEDSCAFLNWINPDEEWNIKSINQESIMKGFRMRTQPLNEIEDMISEFVDVFDIECIEAIRRNREIYLEKVSDAIK